MTEIGLGCWQLGGDWGKVSDESAQEILQTAYDQGIRFLDTAAVYGSGRSERAIGRFLKTVRGDIFVATKIARTPNAADFTGKWIRESTLQSLEHLQRDTVDLTQLHCVPMACLKKPVVWEELQTLKAEGLIRHFGASVESIEEARLCMQQEGLSSLQIIFNIFRQHPRDEIFAEAKEKRIALIVRVPLASGLLSGKFTNQTRFGEDDHRNYNKDGAAFHVGETFAGIPFPVGVALAEKVKKRLPAGQDMAQAALRWILDHDAVTTVIPGASSPAQVISNAAAASLPPLSAAVHGALIDLYTAEIKALVRGQY